MKINKPKEFFVILRALAPSCFHPAVALALLAAFSLSACESDFIADPTRPRPTRAVQSPNDLASPNSEAIGPASGAVPFLVVGFPNTKDEQPSVRTIFDPQGTNPPQSSATHPATEPARENAQPPNSILPVRIVAQRKPEDQFALARNGDDDLDITVTCPSGIGNLQLERTGDAWPAVIHVVLRYSNQKPFAVLEGFNAAEVVSDSQHLSLKATIHKTDGRADIAIPAFVRSNRIAIDWTDVYR